MKKEEIVSNNKKFKVLKIGRFPEGHSAKKCGHNTFSIRVETIEIKDALKSMDEWGIAIINYLAVNNIDTSYLLGDEGLELYNEIKNKI